jgi:LmbE family N-acetylglucosaminyl deacetylase
VIECVAFSPHPDDAELFCSGFLLMAKKAGLHTAVVDLTAGELSTNGNPELRRKESTSAAEILGLDDRRNLGIPDGNIANNLVFV